ncbi:MAG: tRNA 2-thiouridine(34) synthase MnmA [Actinomycetota bacterium]|nr:tRNA 2-thiouridine(34) synthase MnmA [Actinomycetota bacterium]
MDLARFEEHLSSPHRRGHDPAGADTAAAGGAACGDLVRISVLVEADQVTAVGFDASGCGAALAAGSAAVSLVDGRHVLEAARIGTREISDELGGLSPGKLHAADLAADALARALGAAVRRGGDSALEANRTLVAMSGGVDSAVAALLTTRAGRESVGVTLELWRDPENDAEASCCSATAVRQARALAHSLDMPHFTLDLRDEFRAGVVQPFLDGYARGETPNPCVLCNGNIRLDAMLDFAESLGAAELATGHYARRTDDGLLQAAAHAAKDQAYMLAGLGPASVARMRFPLGEIDKPQVRALARDAGLAVADKRESQDLCFLAGTGKARFLARHADLQNRPGPIVDATGREVGRHSGHHLFTVGQRRGVGVASTEPLYVTATDAATNTVTVGPRPKLSTTAVRLRDTVLHRPATEVDAVKLRYRSQAIPCRVDSDSGTRAEGDLVLTLIEPADAAAPGQAAVLLRGDAVAGWGTISAQR